MKYILLLAIYFTFVSRVFAHILPYPSYMPGHKFYHVERVLDRLKTYWYWGNISQFKYHLDLADKYLVEAKTLFEYNQYLLAVDALQRSNFQIQLLKPATDAQTKILVEAMGTHIVTIQELSVKLPNEFTWQPEKNTPTYIPIKLLLDEGRQLRETVLIQ